MLTQNPDENVKKCCLTCLKYIRGECAHLDFKTQAEANDKCITKEYSHYIFNTLFRECLAEYMELLKVDLAALDKLTLQKRKEIFVLRKRIEEIDQ